MHARSFRSRNGIAFDANSERPLYCSAGKMRIALLVPTLEIGGVERVFTNLASGLHEQGVEVDLVVGKTGGGMGQHLGSGIRVFDLGCDRMLLSVPRLARYLRARAPEALIAAMTHSSAAAVLARVVARKNVKLIATEHNTMSKIVANTRGLKYRLMPLWSRWALGCVDHIVAVCGGVADDLSAQTGIPRSKFHVIYNPVISDALYDAALAPVEHSWFQAGELPVVLAVGRLDKQKDFPMLVRAFRLVRDLRPARLLILGEGPDRIRIGSEIVEQRLTADVALPGFEHNPYRFMKRSAVFALSSAWEGFGVVLVEALALGLPVVSTNCTYGPAEILCNGKYGALVPVGDHVAMAQSLINALDNPVQKCVSHIQQFTIRAVASEYLSLIRQ
jgi:glycosyltransferase involved in cell wall biosynthesis